MDATHPGASRLAGYAAACIVRRGAAQAPAYAIAKTLAGKAEIGRFRILEDQFHDALALARFSVG